jgi:hypothetical protein
MTPRFRITERPTPVERLLEAALWMGIAVALAGTVYGLAVMVLLGMAK